MMSGLITTSLIVLDSMQTALAYINSLPMSDAQISFVDKAGYYITMRAVQHVKSLLCILQSYSGLKAACNKTPPAIQRHCRITGLCLALIAVLTIAEFVLMKALYDSLVADFAQQSNVLIESVFRPLKSLCRPNSKIS